ncbi:T9SS type A sorting domain-containing protein [bacterium]|nr:T9SS type A sorting domain-containing protein [bacterium]
MKRLVIFIIWSLTATLLAQSPVSEIGYSYNADTQSYSFMTKSEYSYDVSGNIQEEIISGYLNGAWTNQTRDVNSYANGKITETLRYNYSNNTWQQYEKTTYTQNGENLLTQILFQEWDGQSWINIRRSVYTYNTGILEHREQQNYTNGAWVNSVKEIFAHNGQQQQISLELYTWNSGQYQLSSRTLTTWNAQGNMEAEHIDISISGVWTAFQKLERSYDNNHRLEIYLESFYNSSSAEWTPNMRSINAYDNSTGDLLVINFENYVATGDPATSWVPSWKYEYSYNRTAVDQQQYLLRGFQLQNNYPNPFNPSTTVSFTLPEAANILVDVFNVKGERVAILADGQYTAGNYQRLFLAESLPSGTYFYRLKTTKATYIKKMLLLK